jgi:hypothetical protein
LADRSQWTASGDAHRSTGTAPHDRLGQILLLIEAKWTSDVVVPPVGMRHLTMKMEGGFVDAKVIDEFSQLVSQLRICKTSTALPLGN